MSKVKNGDKIQIHYKGTLTENGQLFDTSEGREPLEFTVGEGMVISGFDSGVLDMVVGEKRVLNIPHLHAYGMVNEEMFITFNRSELPAELGEPHVGMELHLVDQAGNPVQVVVSEINEENFTVDANHPLAGKDLTFEVELVSIVS